MSATEGVLSATEGVLSATEGLPDMLDGIMGLVLEQNLWVPGKILLSYNQVPAHVSRCNELVKL